jgi:hypothetical protein
MVDARGLRSDPKSSKRNITALKAASKSVTGTSNQGHDPNAVMRSCFDEGERRAMPSRSDVTAKQRLPEFG